MTDANPVTPKWVKVLIRTVGAINAAAVVLGVVFLVDAVHGVVTGAIAAPESSPYFRFSFAAMAVIQLVFLSVLLMTAIRFIQAKLSAANLYSLIVVLLIVYFMAVGKLWLVGRGIGMSIAAATGITGGTGPFELVFLVPFLYPIISMVMVQLLQWRFGRKQSRVSAFQVD